MCWFAFTLVGSFFIYLAVASADKSAIMVNATRESWITMENLTTLLEVSFNVSKCCNVYISGKSAGTEKIFNEFLTIYPYEYVVNNTTYNCDGYFMISESVDNLVTDIRNIPTTISTTEVLIIVDDNVEDSTDVFNVSMYENANVNIVAFNGLWSLSENFLKPRVFKMFSRHDELVHKRGIVNFEGRELQAAALYMPPLCYLQKTVNRTVNGIDAQFFVAKNESELDGMEFKLFMLIAERLNFTWTIRTPSSDSRLVEHTIHYANDSSLYFLNQLIRYGTANKTHWNGGLIGLLVQKEVDIAFSSIWLTEDSYRFANLTTPWSDIEIHFLVPRPMPHTSFWALTRPLSREVWFAVLAMLIIQSIYVYTSAWISPRITKRFQSFAITWTELMGRLIGTSAPRNMQGLKIQFQLWHFIGVLVVTAYSSSLAASLTNSSYDKRIDTPRDFMRANLTWGQKGTKPDFDILFNQHDRHGRRFREQYETETSDADRHEKLLKGNYAIIGSKVSSNFFPEDFVRSEDLKNLRLMKQHLCKYYSTFAVQPWLLESTDMVMLWLKEGGLVDYHVHDVLHRRTGSALREVLIEHDGSVKGARVLKLTPLAAGFSMLIVGLFISTIVFYTELYSFSRKKSIREVLLDIKRNRDAWRVMELTKKFRYPIVKTIN